MSAAALVIGGPTASGKSALALALAREFGGAIINADASQLYRELPILTAQPTAPERALAPHCLYGVLPAATVASAEDWRQWAIAAIAEQSQAGRVPIVVGGSGLYLKALLEGFSPIPAFDAAARTRARALWQEMGSAAFRAELAKHDPAIVARLKPADGQRHMRAMEVWLGSGKPLSHWQSLPRSGPPAGLRFLTLVLAPPRPALRQGIETRFMGMIETGVLAEVETALSTAQDHELPAFRALGFAQLRNHLKKNIDLNQSITEAISATRQYAKRQATWFSHQILADQLVDKQFSEIKLPEIFSFIRQNKLTPIR